jgi:hypothetical protein
MNKANLLRTLVVANVLLAFAAVGSRTFFAWTLPAGLEPYMHTRWAGFTLSSGGGVIQLLLLAVTSLFAFAAWIGLLGFWRYARELYLIAWALELAHVLISGPRVDPAVSAVFRSLDGLSAGAILGLAYFSDLARRFERGTAEQPAPAHVGLGTHRA